MTIIKFQPTGQTHYLREPLPASATLCGQALDRWTPYTVTDQPVTCKRCLRTRHRQPREEQTNG